MIGVLGIIILMLLLFLVELPVGLAMGVVGLAGLWYLLTADAALTKVGTEIWSTFSNYGLTVIPLFILMGQICFYSGVNKRLYQTAYTWLGRTPGGLAVATILACAGFSAICGSNTATAATMTTVALPEMKKFDYKPILSSASIACGSTLGVVIPPSVVLIVYGIYAEESIGKLFWGTVIPGLLITGLFCLTVLIICLVRPEMGPAGPRTSFMEKLKSIPGASEMIVLFTLVMVGLYFGFYSPTEAGAAGALFALILALIRRRLTWQGMVASVVDTLKVTSMIILIVTGAIIFGRFLTLSRMPYELADYVAQLPVDPVFIIVVIFAIYAVAGSVMDALGFLLVSIPIFLPVVRAMGYDPIWFGVTLTLVTTMGAITPPVGISAYVVAGIDKEIPLGTVFKGVIWFLPAYIIVTILLLAHPQLVLWLPSFVR
ncbi:TRAP transporter large permease [Thermodesulfobacteriota bacterium]